MCSYESIMPCFRWCHVVSFVWCFGYIAFFRTAHMFGLPEVLPHVNAVQLFLTLRVKYKMLLFNKEKIWSRYCY